MGRQSARIFYNGKDHKEVFFNGSYHNAIFMNGEIVWQKLGGVIDTNISTRNKFVLFSPSTVPNHLFLYANASMGYPRKHYAYEVYSEYVQENEYLLKMLDRETYSCGYFYFELVDDEDGIKKVWYTKDHTDYHKFPSVLEFDEKDDETEIVYHKKYEFRLMSQDYVWYIETSSFTNSRNILQCRVLGDDIDVVTRYDMIDTNIYGIYPELCIENHIIVTEYGGKYYMFNQGFVFPTDISEFLGRSVRKFVDGDYIYSIDNNVDKTTIYRINQLGIEHFVAEIDGINYSIIHNNKVYGAKIGSTDENSLFIYDLEEMEGTTISLPQKVYSPTMFFEENGKFYYMYTRDGYLMSVLELEV